MTTPGQPTGSFNYAPPGSTGGAAIPPPSAPAAPTAPRGPGAPGAPVPPTQPRGARSRLPGRRQRGGGVSWVVYAATVIVLVLAILVVLFVAQNDQRVTIWLFGTRKYMSVAGALSIAAAAGLVVGLLLGVITQIPVRRKLRAAKRRLEG
ncbi:lipopolysaccharide assembly protein LapA domain-containing protein [Pseudofrankia sp. BMG5.37]|nr:lipopolysaccharide assembly protein LapA domain-containing protein [Pseudofrankia sp. BMG5.36]MDT3441853.1 lipopolysaccharide assembly protein LapA domain-containing protein [Pseudofrankia sp. BMG5.37]OHV45677.1 hypothetical protein BCD48_22055 [Pseudofrankia sp. BMG5.36]